MPFQQVNVAGIAPIGNPAARDMIRNIASGMQAGAMPFQMQQQQQARELANKLAQARLAQAPEQMQQMHLANALKQAQLQGMPEQLRQQGLMNQSRGRLLSAQAQLAEKQSEDPFYGKMQSGAVGQALGLRRLKDVYGPDSEEYKTAQSLIQFNREKEKSTIDRNNALSNSIAYRTATPNRREQMIATAVGMGLDPAEASNLLASGANLKDIARKQGIDSLDSVTPIYALSGQDISQLRNRRAFVNEIQTLERRMNQGVEKYGRRFYGMSPAQVVDAITGESPDRQGMFLAARALQPELSSLRLKAAGGSIGIEAIREMQHASLGNTKIFESLVSPKARTAMNKYISKWLDEAVSSYSNSIQSSASLKTERREKSQSNYAQGGDSTVLIRRGGRAFRIPRSQLNEALRSPGVQLMRERK